MWAAKFTLRSHFDGVRHVLFHPSEPVVFTASEDHTIKLWHLNRTLQSKKHDFERRLMRELCTLLLSQLNSHALCVFGP